MSFANFHEIEADTAINTDICIIGAGAAGIAMARHLSGSNLSVTLIESGGFDIDGDVQDLAIGQYSGLEYLPLDAARLRFFGGSTNHWASQSTPLDPLDFEWRDWVPDSGWPISYDVLKAYLPQAQDVCQLGPEPFDWNYWDAIPETPDFPFARDIFEPIMFRYAEPILLFGQAYRGDIDRAENVRCLLDATLVGMELDDAKFSIASVTVSHPTTPDRRISIVAQKFVLAAGGIENSRLLLQSPGRSGQGVGNSYDQVGRYFMEHPNYNSGEIRLAQGEAFKFLGPNHRTSISDHEVRLDFRIKPERQRELEILNHTGFLLPLKKKYKDKSWTERAFDYWVSLENKIFETFGAAEEPTAAQDRPYTFRMRLEQPPLADNRIILTNEVDVFGLAQANMHLQISELERRTIEVLQTELATELGRSDAGRMRITFDRGDVDWQNDFGWQVHHLGGTRMSTDPAEGVVDTNCRVHETSNLYVAGSSVFPTGGHANPTLNLVALTLRLADHLKRETT